MAVPTTTALTPTKSLLAGGVIELATGTGYTGTTGVTVGGTAATAVTVNSDTSLNFTTPTKTAGTYAVVVTNATGASTVNLSITYHALATVTALTPATAGLGGNDIIVLTGTGFTDAQAVKQGASFLDFTIINDTTIHAQTIAHAAGAVAIGVNTSGGAGTTTATLTFGKTTTETYAQEDGDDEFNQFFMDIDLSPVSLASGELYKRLDPVVYPQVGLIDGAKQGTAGSAPAAPAPVDEDI